MNRTTIFSIGMAIATVSILFGSGHMIGNEKVFAFGGVGHSWGGHGWGLGGHGFGHLYGPGFGYSYRPGYVIDNPCGGGPYSIIGDQIVCTTG